jgi:hypothetical protein
LGVGEGLRCGVWMWKREVGERERERERKRSVRCVNIL